jgi:excisionase family DNA binding protein
MARPKDVLTTGDVARICNVAPRTVSKWFDTGKLRGYRIPGSKDRRIPLQQLVRFMKMHGIPLNGLETGAARVLIAESDPSLADLLAQALAVEAGYEVQVARCAFEAGAIAGVFKPHVMFLDVEMPGLSGREALRAIRGQPDLAFTRLVALAGALREGEVEAIRQQGFDAVLVKPFEVSQAVRTIEESLAVEA